MANIAKPIDKATVRSMHANGDSPEYIAKALKVHKRRIYNVLGVQMPVQDTPQDSDEPVFTVELRIAYTEVQLDEAIADFTAEEKAHALGHVMFLRAGG